LVSAWKTFSRFHDHWGRLLSVVNPEGKKGKSLPLRPVTSLGHQGWWRVFWEWPKFLNYVQYFQTTSNTFFQRRIKFF